MFEPGKKPGTVQVTIAKNIDAAARVLLDHVEHLHWREEIRRLGAQA